MATNRNEGVVRNIYLFLMSAAALIVRLFPWRYAVLDRNIIFGQPDAYYHLRRATIIARNFPALPGIDHYMAYPYGAEAPWPPLYDHFIGIVSLLIGAGNPSDETIMLVTTFLPPVLAALTVVPLYLLAKKLFGEQAGLAAAFFAVMMPGQLAYSVIGSGDHHTAEVFFLVLYFLCLLREGDPEGEGKPSFRFPWSGVFLGAGTLVWQGQVVFATVSAGALAVWILGGRFRQVPGRGIGDPVRAFTISTATAAVLVSLGRLAYPSETSQTRFDFGFFSWFQPVYLAGLIASVWALRGVLSGFDLAGRKGISRARAAACAFATAAVLLLVSLVAFPELWENIRRGVQFILRKNAYLESINEFQPLFSGSIWPGAVTLRFLFDVLYFGTFFLPPVVAAGYFASRWRKNGVDYPSSLFLVWTVLLFLLTLEQKRWGNAYGANMAVAIGMAFSALLEKNRSLQRQFRDFREWRLERSGAGGAGAESPAGLFRRLFLESRRAPLAGSVLLFLGLLTPYYFLLRETYVAPARPITPDLYNSLIWLRENTPRTSNPWNPRARPEYAVLAEWDVGHWIQYIAERPTVVNNFGYQLRGNGLEDWLRFEFAETEPEAVEICRKRGVRYLFLTDNFYAQDTIPRLIGIDFPKEFHSRKPAGHVPLPNDRYYSRVAARMYYFDGSASPYGHALSRFRLVFESRNPSNFPHQPPDTKEVKIYELVQGAEVRGTADPGQKVVIACRLHTNFDRQFEFETFAVGDERGRFRAVVPYASSDNNIMVDAAGPYLAYTESSAAFFHVSGKDVTEGGTVEVDLKRKGLPAGAHARVGPFAPPEERRPAGRGAVGREGQKDGPQDVNR